MSDIKPNFTHLARQFECDPRTVKRYYENDLSKKKASARKRSSKLEPFRSIIQEKVELGCSASAIYRFIKKEGYEGRDSILRDYCSPIAKHTHSESNNPNWNTAGFVFTSWLERRSGSLESFGPTVPNQFIFICSRLFTLAVYRVNAGQKTRYTPSLFEQCLSLFRRNSAWNLVW